MANILLKNISKHFDSVIAIDQVSFEVRNSEFLVLVGLSGFSKSNLLRSIAGLENITGGQIHIDDKNVTEIHSLKRGLAMVFSPMLSTHT